jgi:hypothetical protein
MVIFNSVNAGVNTPEKDLYVRTINEFRIDIENSFLFFVDYLISLGKTKINSELLEEEINYLNLLRKRYHKKNILIKINSDKKEGNIDSICLLIKESRKILDYCILDLIDFYFKEKEIFSDFKLNKNFASLLKDKCIEYNKIIPKKINKVPNENLILKNENEKEEKIIFIKEKIIDNIYLSVDKFFLKVYDYLIETDKKIIDSKALYFLKKDFEEIRKKYFKVSFSTKIKNSKPKLNSEKVLEEIGMNLIRIKNLLK